MKLVIQLPPKNIKTMKIDLKNFEGGCLTKIREKKKTENKQSKETKKCLKKERLNDLFFKNGNKNLSVYITGPLTFYYLCIPQDPLPFIISVYHRTPYLLLSVYITGPLTFYYQCIQQDPLPFIISVYHRTPYLLLSVYTTGPLTFYYQL